MDIMEIIDGMIKLLTGSDTMIPAIIVLVIGAISGFLLKSKMN